MDMQTILGWLIGGFGVKAAAIAGAIIVAYEAGQEIIAKAALIQAAFPHLG